MLMGMGAAVLPIVLHLLSRARYRDVDWAAMMFLDGADAPRRRNSRFTQWLLLGSRSLVIALLAAALARPVVRGAWAGQRAAGHLTAALLLDCSASMGFDENGRTRFQMAQAAARQILRNLRPGDRVSLILLGSPRSAADMEPTADLRAVESRVDDARVEPGSASVREGFDLAAEILARYGKSDRDIYLVTDRQALTWRGVDDAWAADFRQRLRAAGQSTRLFVLPVGGADADNLAVESARVVNPPAIAGQPTDVEVIVRNYGSVQHAAVPVSLEGAALNASERAVSLAAGQSAPAVFSVTFTHPGAQALTARLRSSGYTGDDQLDLAVNVIAPIRVLIVSGDERAGGFRGAGNYLSWALAPRKSAGVPGADPCNVTVVAADAWSEADLSKYQVVVLADVERFTAPQAQALDKFVYSGGGLLIAPGTLCRVDDYNARLYRDGAGVMPAQLQPPTSADGSDATTILGLSTDHPVFQFLRGRVELPSAQIIRYFPATPRQVRADVLARCMNDNPLLIQGRSEGGGRTLLLTTSLDADWSSLPLTNFYLPFVQSAVRYLADGAVPSGNLAPGKAILIRFDDPNPSRVITLDRPDGRRVKLEAIRRDKHAEVRYADTELPGTYKVTVQEAGQLPETLPFVVRPPREESDLTQLTPEGWQTMERSIGFTRLDPSRKPLAETLSANREGRELWGVLLAAVFVLSAAELALSRVGSIERAAPAPAALQPVEEIA